MTAINLRVRQFRHSVAVGNLVLCARALRFGQELENNVRGLMELESNMFHTAQV